MRTRNAHAGRAQVLESHWACGDEDAGLSLVLEFALGKVVGRGRVAEV